MVDICNQQQKVEFPQECEALMRAACEKALSLFELHQPRDVYKRQQQHPGQPLPA